MAKVKVNHTGACGRYTFEADKAFEINDADVQDLEKALGKDITVIERKAEKKEPEKEPEKEPAKEEKKEAKPEHDKMIHKDQKVVTK